MPSIAQLERLLASDPNDPFVLYGLAQEYAKQHQTDKAVEYYDRCLAADPAYCYAYFHKARALQDVDRTAEAVATVREGLEAARKAQDGHALGELQTLLDELA